MSMICVRIFSDTNGNQHQRCVANFSEIVKGFGMLPNKILQKVSTAEILQNARVGTAVPCLLQMIASYDLIGFIPVDILTKAEQA